MRVTPPYLRLGDHDADRRGPRRRRRRPCLKPYVSNWEYVRRGSGRRRVRATDGSRPVLTNNTPTKRRVCWLRLFAVVETVRDGVDDGTTVGAELRRDLQGVEHPIADGVTRRIGVGLVETCGDVVDDGGRYINSQGDRVCGSGHKQGLYARAPSNGR